jgi:hypothetical protein
MSRRKPPPGDLLASMTEAEAAWVLRGLLVRHPELRDEARELLHGEIARSSRADVAVGVRGAVLGASLREVWDRAGAHAHGYVDEADAAWELCEEALEPFVDEMERLLGVGELVAARASFEGILLGLYGLPRVPEDGALSRAEDFPSEAALGLVDRWLAAGGPAPDRATIARVAPKWSAALSRRGAR